MLVVARVTQHSASNSMDSKNLAICWWPTLMWPEITSMDTMMLTTRPLEQLVQLLIDQHGFFFHGETEVNYWLSTLCWSSQSSVSLVVSVVGSEIWCVRGEKSRVCQWKLCKMSNSDRLNSTWWSLSACWDTGRFGCLCTEASWQFLTLRACQGGEFILSLRLLERGVIVWASSHSV